MTDQRPAGSSDAPHDSALEAEVLSKAVEVLRLLRPDARERMLATLMTFFGIAVGSPPPPSHVSSSSRDRAPFTEDRAASPKEFLFEKRPATDVDRAACLAFYMTHFRETNHFKTIDISKLNTEAAQVKFSNTASAVTNAIRAGLLASVGRGHIQMTALGEVYVRALPDRDAARAALKGARPRRRGRKAAPSSNVR